jgi:peroxiredoxin (alkyl hydroperoxide reductase subunit C)
LLSDPGGEVSRAYDVLDAAEGRAFRATVIVSPEGRIAHLLVSPMNVGRSVEETLRVLDALQTGRLCPADWRPGEPTIAVDPAHRF